MSTADEVTAGTGRPIHEFRSGSIVAAVCEVGAASERNFQLTIALAEDGTAEQPLVRCAGAKAADLSTVVAQAAKLIEYLDHGLSYEVWREDYDPTYHPECRPRRKTKR